MTIHLTYAQAPGGIKQRFAPGEWERATNRQQRRLTKAYDSWSASARKALVNLARSGGTIPEQHALFEKLLRALQLQLQQVYGRGIEIAKNISAGSRADRPSVQKLAEDHTREGIDLIATALIPAIMMKLSIEIARGAAEDPQMLRDAFMTTRTMPPQYAGGFWVMIFDTQKTLGKERELERISQGLTIEPIRWVLDPHAVHCQHSGDHYGCMELEGEYPGGWNALKTVPAGQTTCRGNCKCHIEVYRDGAWRRGVYEA